MCKDDERGMHICIRIIKDSFFAYQFVHEDQCVLGGVVKYLSAYEQVTREGGKIAVNRLRVADIGEDGREEIDPGRII